MVQTMSERARLARRVTIGTSVGAVGANLLGSVVVFGYLQFLSPQGAANAAIDPADVRVTAVVFVVYIVATFVLGTLVIGRYSARWVGWLSAGEAPTPLQHRRTLQLPGVAAATFLSLWLLAAVVFGLLQVILGNPIAELVRISVGIVLAGLVTTGLGFLVVERAFRPAIAEALVGHEEAVSSRGLGIRARLGVAWALGSGVPLVSVALAAGTMEGVDLRVRVPIVVLALIGLAAGGLMTRAMAISVAVPLERVRSAVEAVRAGDLAVSVPVDDGGDIGMLEIGVNRMVEATRERLRVQELFGRHVGEAVAQLAVEGNDELGGQATTASVLFADVIGSTGLAGALGPAGVIELLNDFFQCVVDATAAEGGFVNKFAGDGALCVFGPPAGDDLHAQHALAAARRLHELLRQAETRRVGLDAAIGVSTGHVVAGNVGAADRFEYTVIGDPVNEAARLTELAKDERGRTLASGAAVAAAGALEAARWERADRRVLRGRDQPTDLFVPAGTLLPGHDRRRGRRRART